MTIAQCEYYRVLWSCYSLTSMNGYSMTRTVPSGCLLKMILFMNTQSSTSNTHPMKSDRKGIPFTSGTVEQVSWYTCQCTRRTRMSPGCMLASSQFTMLPCAPPPALNHKPSQSCGCGGCSATQLASPVQTCGTTPKSHSFHGPAPSAVHSTLLIHCTSSGPVTLFPPSTSDRPMNSSIHLFFEIQRGIGVLTMQTGMV